MKDVKTQIRNYEIETIITAGHDLVEYIKEYPERIEYTSMYLTSENKDNLLIYFSEQGYIKQVKLLIDHRVDIHVEKDLALRLSSENGHLDVVKYLVEQGADIHARQDYALRWSAEHGHLEVVKYLVEHTADISINNYEVIQQAKEKGHVEVFDYLEGIRNETN